MVAGFGRRGCQGEACLVVAGSELVVGSVLVAGCVCMNQVSSSRSGACR